MPVPIAGTSLSHRMVLPRGVKGAGGKGEDRDHGRLGECHGAVWGVCGPALPHLMGPLSSVHGESGSFWHGRVDSRVWAPWGHSGSP